MAIDFPDSPTLNEEFTAASRKWIWDGTVWNNAEDPILPDFSNNAGDYLYTDGLSVLWNTVDALPDQGGNAGKFLVTDGSEALWSTIIEGGSPTETPIAVDQPTQTATVTNAVGDGAFVTYTANNSFSPGQVVTITDILPTAYRSVIREIVSSNSTSFTVASTGTGAFVSGGLATANSKYAQSWTNTATNTETSVFGNGAIYSNGLFDTNQLGSGVYLGRAIDGPRVMFVPLGATDISTNWTIDLQPNGRFRWFSPGITQMSLIDGSLAVNGNAENGGPSITANVASASRQGIRVRAATAQTANLQEWQNSAGTNVASVSPAGNILVAEPTASSHATTKSYVDGRTPEAIGAAPRLFVENIVTANYTLQLSDISKVIAFNSSSNLTLVVPLNASVAFPIGTIINVYRAGIGTVTITGQVGVTVRNAGTVPLQFGERSLRKRGTDEWVLT
jgi:hypothetical protein